ncbi:hypothetical protein BGZ95_004037 [Linnemannia exigua]|uniref:D-arabinono-1,4-lactone oxidase n=1 Tax=Linnemannia exigua TaxID=604196 RepID=A0AAD4H955_9FUNG|nr:hypothetical protein BGZ95_004037 [Linnemannia exigua]
MGIRKISCVGDITQSSQDRNDIRASCDIEPSIVRLNINEPTKNTPAVLLSSITDDRSEPIRVAITKQTTSKPGTWTNWAKNQTCHPSKTMQPRTLQCIVELVKNAKAEKNKIRCVAGGYTWSSSSVVQEDDVLVFVDKMTKIFSPVYVKGQGWTVELETGVTVKALDDYLRKHDPPLAMPTNTVLDSACFGGILALGSHGAATHSRTLSDLACEVKIVDANGTLNTFTREKNPVEFSAAACNLGLLGIIYTYTLRIEPMFNVVMIDTYPLLTGYLGCPKQGGARLKEMVLQNDQTQLFYWPFNSHLRSKRVRTTGGHAQDEIWIKQWRRTDQLDSGTAVWKLRRKVRQFFATSLGNNLLRIMACKPKTVPWISCLISKGLKRVAEKVLPVPDAIHFMGNLKNAIVIGLELVFKIDEDFEKPCQAMKFIVNKIHEYAGRGEYPVSMTVDMRFIKASNQIMSYVYDSDPDVVFCTIEILSAVNTKGFAEFSAMIAQHFMSEYQARPHWAKHWEHIPGIIPYLREQSRPQLDQFESIRQKYDPQGMFMNKTFAGLLGH